MTFDALRFFHDGSTGTPDPAPAPALRAPTSKPAGYAGLRTEKILAASRFMLSRISLFPVQAIVLPHSVEHSISVPPARSRTICSRLPLTTPEPYSRGPCEGQHSDTQ